MKLIFWPFVFVTFIALLPLRIFHTKGSGCDYRHNWMKWYLFDGRTLTKPMPPSSGHGCCGR